jgi:hypothetical protein
MSISLIPLQKKVCVISSENSNIMREFISANLPQTSDLVNPMILSMENNFSVNPAGVTSSENIKKNTINITHNLIRSVISNLYNESEIDTSKVSETLVTSLNTIEDLILKFSEQKFKPKKALDVDDEFIKSYLAESQDVIDYIPKTTRVLRMLLKKYVEFPIIKRYINLMYSILNFSRIWTKNGGIAFNYLPTKQGVVDFVNAYRSKIKNDNPKRFIALTTASIIAVSGIIFTLFKGSNMKTFLTSGNTIHIVLWLISVGLCFFLLSYFYNIPTPQENGFFPIHDKSSDGDGDGDDYNSDSGVSTDGYNSDSGVSTDGEGAVTGGDTNSDTNLDTYKGEVLSTLCVLMILKKIFVVIIVVSIILLLYLSYSIILNHYNTDTNVKFTWVSNCSSLNF